MITDKIGEGVVRFRIVIEKITQNYVNYFQ